MVRLTRAESMAITRERLLQSALKLYKQFGYEAVTIEKIVAREELSRGAFYAHFPSKEAIFMELAVQDAADAIPNIIKSIQGAASRQEAIDVICDWADHRKSHDDLSYLVLDVLQHAKSHQIPDEHIQPIRNYWTQMGLALQPFFPCHELPGEPEEIGSIILLIIVEGPFVNYAGGPQTNRLLRLTLEAFLR